MGADRAGVEIDAATSAKFAAELAARGVVVG